jgi:hypothetical protein
MSAPIIISGRTLNPTLIPGRFGTDFFWQGNYAASCMGLICVASRETINE